jgi:hypothetical protein
LKNIRLSEFGHWPTSQSAQVLLAVAASYHPRVGTLTAPVTTGDWDQRRRYRPPAAASLSVTTLSLRVDAQRSPPLILPLLRYAHFAFDTRSSTDWLCSPSAATAEPPCVVRLVQKERLNAMNLLHRVPAWGTGYRSRAMEFSAPLSSSVSTTVVDQLSSFPGQADEPCTATPRPLLHRSRPRVHALAGVPHSLELTDVESPPR